MTCKVLTAIALKELSECYPSDPELAHIQADEVLCDLLTQLGYEEVVEAYKKLPKWYA